MSKLLESSWTILKHIEALDDMLEDTEALKHMGLTDEDIIGYEEFYFSTYFPNNMEVA